MGGPAFDFVEFTTTEGAHPCVLLQGWESRNLCVVTLSHKTRKDGHSEARKSSFHLEHTASSPPTVIRHSANPALSYCGFHNLIRNLSPGCNFQLP